MANLIFIFIISQNRSKGDYKFIFMAAGMMFKVSITFGIHL